MQLYIIMGEVVVIILCVLSLPRLSATWPHCHQEKQAISSKSVQHGPKLARKVKAW